VKRPPLLILAPAALAILIFAVYFVVWRHGAAAMRRAVDDWAEDRRALGAAVSFDSLKTTGFPLFLRGVLSDVSIGEGDSWTWSAPKLFIDAQPLAPDRLIFSAREPHLLDVGGAGRWRIAAPDGRASIEGDKERGWELNIEAGKSRLQRSDGLLLSADSFLLSASPNAVEADRIFIGLLAKNVGILGLHASAAFDQVDCAFAATGVASVSEGAMAWRNAGGAIEIQKLLIVAGGGKLSISGEIGIDAQGFPAGTLAVEISNPAPLVEAFRDVGAIRSEDSNEILAALTLAAVAGGGRIAAPLILTDGEASFAGIRLGPLPKLDSAGGP